MPKTGVVLGARNLGGAIIDDFLAHGWNAAGVARSEDTLARVRERGALAIDVDASDPAALNGALQMAREQLGSADADVEAFEGWTVAVAEQAFVFLSTGLAALRETGGGALIQITGGSSRRAMPGRGLWAAGAFATRALVQAAAQEMRASGVHVALLAVDATIASPKTEAFTQGTPTGALAEMSEIARAVAHLVEQGDRAYTHEMVLTPAGERWGP